MRNESLADKVFAKLESDILEGKYKKGDVLTEIGLSNTFEVSRTPIREAIRRLEQENLVTETGKELLFSA
jgi:DNA-binding GntR family transcriptional regulator